MPEQVLLKKNIYISYNHVYDQKFQVYHHIKPVYRLHRILIMYYKEQCHQYWDNTYLLNIGGSWRRRWKSVSELTWRSRWCTAHLNDRLRFPLICQGIENKVKTGKVLITSPIAVNTAEHKFISRKGSSHGAVP